jgi:hypothetical protein
LEVFTCHFKEQKRNITDGRNEYQAHVNSKVRTGQFTTCDQLFDTALKSREEKNEVYSPSPKLCFYVFDRILPYMAIVTAQRIYMRKNIVRYSNA